MKQNTLKTILKKKLYFRSAINQKNNLNLKNKFYTIISLGDPAGVGREILNKLVERKEEYFAPKEQSFLKNCIIIGDLYSNDKKIERLYNIIPFHEYKNIEEILENIESTNNEKPVYLYLKKDIKTRAGKPSTATGKRALEYLKKALGLCKDLPCSALVTLPVSKEYIIKSGINFSGHTEFLQDFWQRQTFMLMYHPQLSVLPLTTHIPISDVPEKIKKVNFAEMANALLLFKQIIADKKPVALMGLNPHAGENGKIGTEEKFLIEKMKFLTKKGIKVEGPYAADGFFSTPERKNYSISIVSYHDQGLIPFKMLSQFDGVNITLNLPKLRISPAHGTAYSIAGKNKADVNSILKSLKFAFKWGKPWIQYSSYQPFYG